MNADEVKAVKRKSVANLMQLELGQRKDPLQPKVHIMMIETTNKTSRK